MTGGRRGARRDAGASRYAFPRRSVGTRKRETRQRPASGTTDAFGSVAGRQRIFAEERGKAGLGQEGRSTGCRSVQVCVPTPERGNEENEKRGNAQHPAQPMLSGVSLAGNEFLRKNEEKQDWGRRGARRDAGASRYAFPRRSVGTSQRRPTHPMIRAGPRDSLDVLVASRCLTDCSFFTPFLVRISDVKACRSSRCMRRRPFCAARSLPPSGTLPWL